jgi:hypothetical protein
MRIHQLQRVSAWLEIVIDPHTAGEIIDDELRQILSRGQRETSRVCRRFSPPSLDEDRLGNGRPIATSVERQLSALRVLEDRPHCIEQVKNEVILLLCPVGDPQAYFELCFLVLRRQSNKLRNHDRHLDIVCSDSVVFGFDNSQRGTQLSRDNADAKPQGRFHMGSFLGGSRIDVLVPQLNKRASPPDVTAVSPAERGLVD